MMTMEQAYNLLCEKWPGGSFSIEIQVWHHEDASDNPKIEYAIWDNEAQRHLYGPTLENVMEQVLGHPLAAAHRLFDVDRQIVWAKDRSGYEIIGPLTQENKP